MCFFHYPAPKPRNKKAKKQASLRRAVGGNVVHDIPYEAADDALYQEPAGIGTAAAMYHPNFNYFPYGMEQYFKDEPYYVTRGSWASHGEALNGSLGAAKEIGEKIEQLKGVVSGGVAVARALAGSTQGALEGARDDINNTHAAVQGVNNALRQTHDAINKHYSEHSTKQDRCAAEISKVRTMLEEDAKNKEQARQRQQNMQEAWNYYQWFRQAEQEAEQKSSSKSSSNPHQTRQPSRRNNNTKTSYERQAPLDDPYASEGQGRAPPDQRKLKRSVLECLDQILGEAGSHADRPERSPQNHTHFHAYAPTSPPPWGGAQHYADLDPRGGWQQFQASPFPARDDAYHNNDGSSTRGGPGKRNAARYQCHPVIHNGVWDGRGPNYY
ncbi:uncharacterized protein F4817DRAFT_13696 [Daldinia loculata]|uniref:uncharacterized protein n=1 Tax=Daldinia loculata TaxID=103429 RepID=UPI0020C4267B|nr:uncharacterized protein F4817DRAFT_13696 [Daldinia loculata]KAI1649716.1 hypothetical protein F4817DRAFT_13696 [Daldinia loculata]